MRISISDFQNSSLWNKYYNKNKFKEYKLELAILLEVPQSITIVEKHVLLGQRYDQGTSYALGAIYGIDPVSCHTHQE